MRPNAEGLAPRALYPLPPVRDEPPLARAVAAVQGAWYAVRRRERNLATGRREEPAEAGTRRDAAARLRREGLTREAATDALSVVAGEAIVAWSGAPGDDVLSAALVMVCGDVAELDTAADRVTAVVLAAAAVALAGVPVHVVCPTEHRRERAAELLQPLCERLGLRLGLLGEGTSSAELRSAYRAEVTCGLARHFARDALHDSRLLLDRPADLRLRLEQLHDASPRSSSLLMRGLVCALLPDADLQMLDQCLSTLALTADEGAGEETRSLALAFDVAGLLASGQDYILDEAGWPALTRAGSVRLAAMLESRGGSWSSARWREELVTLALLARFCLEPGIHFTEQPDGVELDEAAVCRVLGSDYARARLVDLLGIRLGRPKVRAGAPLATMSHMEYLLRYHHLAGTMQHADAATRREIWSRYRLRVRGIGRSPRGETPIPKIHVLRSEAESHSALAAIVQSSTREAGPAWVLTPSQETVDGLARALRGEGLRVAVIDARTEGADTGGVDAVLRRVALEDASTDRSWFGPGDLPGDVVFLGTAPEPRVGARWLRRCGPARPDRTIHQFLSLDDPACRKRPVAWLAGLLARRGQSVAGSSGWPARLLLWVAVRVNGRRLRRMRRDHRRIAGRVQKLLAFTGRTGN